MRLCYFLLAMSVIVVLAGCQSPITPVRSSADAFAKSGAGSEQSIDQGDSLHIDDSFNVTINPGESFVPLDQNFYLYLVATSETVRNNGDTLLELFRTWYLGIILVFLVLAGLARKFGRGSTHEN